MKKQYIGSIDNHETRRPALNKLYTVKGSKNLYVLINIRVNGGRYDSYILQNISNGKVITRRRITAIMPESVTDKKGKAHEIPALFTERARTSENNGKTCLPSFSTLAGNEEYSGYKPGCMDELPAIKGTCNCKCPGCYAMKITRYIEVYTKLYLNTLECAINPRRFLAMVEDELFSNNDPAFVRLNDSGDIPSIEFLEAFADMARRHPATTFGTYTKRDDIMHAFGLENIPDNVVISCSPWKDICLPIGDLPQFIYDDGTDPEAATLPHCPAVKKDGTRTGVTCSQCLHCYTARRGDRWAVYAH